jgi:hypothetical protein
MATRKKAAKKAGKSAAGFNPYEAVMFGGGSGKVPKQRKATKAEIALMEKLTGAGPDYVRTKKTVPEEVVEYRALRVKNNPRAATIYRKALGI